MEKENNIIIKGYNDLKENMKIISDMEKEKNIFIMVMLNLKVNI